MKLQSCLNEAHVSLCYNSVILCVQVHVSLMTERLCKTCNNGNVAVQELSLTLCAIVYLNILILSLFFIGYTIIGITENST